MKKLFYAAAFVSAALMTACGGNSNPNAVKMGSKSEFDTLSYVMGSNIARSLDMQLRDIPMNWDVIEEALTEAALAADDSVTFFKHEEQGKILRNYLWQQRGQRAKAIAAKRAEADSIRLASGDTTKVEYPVADPEMFVSEGERDSVSYAIGNDLGYGMSRADVPLHIVWLVQAMKDIREDNAQISEDEANAYWQNYAMNVRPAENLAGSTAWLEKMAAKSGAQVTESGLVYKIAEEGDMNFKPTSLEDVVKVHYTGRLRNGKVFDSSIYENLPFESQMQRKRFMGEEYNANKPVELPLNRVIKGWGEGLQLVGKGGKITLWIPAELAYGLRGTRGIGPNEALEFEVELIDVTPAAKPEVAPEAEEVETAEPAAEE